MADGTSGDDILLGTNNDETIRGGAGNDSIDGLQGNNTLFGDAGNDTLTGSTRGVSRFDWNLASYSNSTAGIQVTLGSSDGTVSTGRVVGDSSIGTDTLIRIDAVRGTAFNDTYTVYSNWKGGQFAGYRSETVGLQNEFRPGLGDDTISGNGVTRLNYKSDATSGLTITFTSNYAGTVTGGGIGVDSFTGVNFVIGSKFADAIVGSDGDESFQPGPGNDKVDGGGGIDRVDFAGSASGVNVNLSIKTAQFVGADDGTDTLTNIERIRGSEFDDVLIGDGKNNYFEGMYGDDLIVGLGGTDTARYRGARADYEVVFNSETRTLTVRDLRDVPWNEGTDQLYGVESLQFEDQKLDLTNGAPVTVVGTSAGETLVGSAVPDIMFGYGGNDRLEGGSGADLLFGGDGNDVLVGAAGADYLDGGVGNNNLYGGGGNDTLTGAKRGLSDDFNTANYDTTSVTQGIAVVLGSQDGATPTGQVSGNSAVGVDTLLNIDMVKGTQYADTYIAHSNWSGGQLGGYLGVRTTGELNTFVPLGGDDVITGNGFTRIRYDLAATGKSLTSGVSITVDASGRGTATGTDIGTDQFTGVNNFWLTSFNDRFVGGSDGENIIAVGGDDYVDGGAGVDRIDYFPASSGVSVDLSKQGAQLISADQGSDTLLNIENIRGSDFNDSLSGNAQDNHLIGRAGDDLLFGGGGNDTLEGNAGVDTARYSLARSSYEVSYDKTSGIFTLRALSGTEGTDTVIGVEQFQFADGTQTAEALLASNPKQAGATVDEASTGTGGSEASYADAPATVSTTYFLAEGQENAAKGLLKPGLFADTDAYGLGLLEAGSYSFKFTAASWFSDASFGTSVIPRLTLYNGEGDVLRSSTTGELQYEVAESGTYVLFVSGSASSKSQYQVSYTATESSTEVVGTDGDDSLEGGKGNDTLYGLEGDDTLRGAGGNDVIDGGVGVDTAKWLGSSSAFRVSFKDGVWSVSDQSGSEGSDRVENIERLNFADRVVVTEAAEHGSYASVPIDLYQFFIVAFNAAPGVTYMNQLAEAYQYGLTVREIVDIFITKPQFTDVYPEGLDLLTLSKRLVENIVQDSASADVKAGAVNDIKAAFDIGMTRGEVIYTVFGNLGKMPLTDATWGGTAKLFANQIAVAKAYTEIMDQSTIDLVTLRAAMDAVTKDSDVSSEDKAIEAAIDGLFGNVSIGIGPASLSNKAQEESVPEIEWWVREDSHLWIDPTPLW
ncbi:MAG: hypothetical protein RJA77_121 [Pseudomonadota bacterium]